MLSDLVEELIGMVFGGVLGDEMTERRAGRIRKRMAAFDKGGEIRVPCAFRMSEQRWRHGSLRLTRGRAVWVGRFANRPSLELNRRTAAARQGRPVAGRESVRLNPKLVVLGYQIENDAFELAVRRRDLPLVGRVLDLPATDHRHR